MASELVHDTQKKHTIQPFPAPELKEDGGLWTCPFCQAIHTDATPYAITTPPVQDTVKLKKAKAAIKQHLEEHRQMLQERLVQESSVNEYEKNNAERMKRVRLWIEGTVKDRGLYEENPF
ncbi:hypothetical protein G6F46_003914 [Rhizopus delemar]|uniref:Uncharacterized protein n=2 Tax=Rhizopus TaxID=4842 RepID=A0A9P6Z8K1_9FUNG|nr:hypothetical protein G6F55_003371 [Rhizopus delemar]KAG1547752.1 hypothetical protein G6F51_004080 [Rhizopus arrhizus]KAG1501056.1 hypothetical protein G6F54_003302 [Rhizopus delemar]KAG1514694.1 hypothetical protein G6F53_003484 [Rhizopus delemar]KAG1522915.1 hypothetical protein G6F52_005451 [Rhizopus delemar]